MSQIIQFKENNTFETVSRKSQVSSLESTAYGIKRSPKQNSLQNTDPYITMSYTGIDYIPNKLSVIASPTRSY